MAFYGYAREKTYWLREPHISEQAKLPKSHTNAAESVVENMLNARNSCSGTSPTLQFLL